MELTSAAVSRPSAGCKNSGFCGLQYAVLLKPKIIHMVGFDLTSKPKQRHYYSTGGPSDPRLHEFFIHFRTAIRILQMNDFQVVSRTRESRLNDIVPYIPFGSPV